MVVVRGHKSLLRLFQAVLSAPFAVMFFQNASMAQTLEDALSNAYCTNSELAAARSRVDVSTEKLAQAKAANRLRVTGEIYAGMAEVDREGLGRISVHPSRYGVVLEKPLYTGGKVAAATSRAESGVGVREAAVVGVEQRIFLTTAEAYLSVRMQTEILALRRRNIFILTRPAWSRRGHGSAWVRSRLPMLRNLRRGWLRPKLRLERQRRCWKVPGLRSGAFQDWM